MKRLFSAFRRYVRRSSQSGQSIVLLALGFIGLAAFVGITTDVSLLFVRYAQLSRAVDSAAIAAANQMRQDRSNASVQLAARQFIEFYGLSPESVIVDTCLTTNFSDPDLCNADQSKLVRVRAYFRQPTAFLRLVGVQYFDMWVAATSQTAALDVVIVLDVSESMGSQTTIEDWAKVEKVDDTGKTVSTTNLGVVYRPPLTNDIVLSVKPGATLDDVNGFWQTWKWGNPDPLPGLLNNPQIVINNYLTYYSKSTGIGRDVAGKATTDTGYSGVSQFRVDFADNYFTDANFPGKGYGSVPSTQPRDACRVRFYPRSFNINVGRFKGAKNADGTFRSYSQVLSAAGLPAMTSGFDGFVPTYNYYGCCNDPDGKDGFDDLVCQPFKQIREATFGFLDRIDFLRGDRAAFVTYDRTAFLVNPFPYLAGADGDETKRPAPMLDSRDNAYRTLKNLIGVRSEPYFYVMTNPGTAADPAAKLISAWTQSSMGFDYTKGGAPIVVDYGKNPYNPADPTVPESINYPVNDNCFVQNAALSYPRSLFSGGLDNASLPTDLTGMRPTSPISYDTTGYDTAWNGRSNGSEVLMTSTGNKVRTSYAQDVSYEYWAACRSGNVGAALREANNALLNPNTSRRFGTIWVIVLMSDGGAGASDPVRRNGRVLYEFKPYTKNSLGTWGIPGEYGAFGLCPIGTPNNPGELVTYGDDTSGDIQAAPPYCADQDPASRHTCDFRPLINLPTHPARANYVAAGINPIEDNNFRHAGETDPTPVPPPVATPDGPGTSASPEEVMNWNKKRNRVYDVDIGVAQPRIYKGISLAQGGCDPLYDVEDYARDWADYIAIANLGTTSSNVQVPTIFTIGFSLAFDPNKDSRPDKTKPLNDPVNISYAQTNVDALCQSNVDTCLGEQLLRYIADIGDNNRIDNDYYQDMMYEWYQFKGGYNPGVALTVDGVINTTTDRINFGGRDACQTQDVGPKNSSYADIDGTAGLSAAEKAAEWGQLRANVSCGNYYYSPTAAQLQFVFDDIASRMFTRLSR